MGHAGTAAGWCIWYMVASAQPSLNISNSSLWDECSPMRQGEREVREKVRQCLRSLFRHRSLQKRNARIMGEGEDAVRDMLCILQEWSWKGRVFNRRHWEGFTLVMLVLGKEENQLHIHVLCIWAGCMRLRESLPDLPVFVDLGLILLPGYWSFLMLYTSVCGVPSWRFAPLVTE